MRSWVESANGHPDFPLENLPLGVFSLGGAPRAGVAIGDMVLDLAAAGIAVPVPLNAFLARGAAARRELRARVTALLAHGATPRPEWLHPQSAVTMHLPATIGDYTDFYVGIHHATAVGKLFRPDNPLLPNYKHIPIGYHGRASSVVPSGHAVRRPRGQLPSSEGPRYAPCGKLDYELELGFWVGPGNAMGEAIPIAQAADHIAGYCLLNDWSARDIQGWEYQPLGPFLAKSFATTISPWIITPEALEPFRIPVPPRPEGDPAPLPYLHDEADQARGALNLELEVLLSTAAMRAAGLAPQRISLSHAKHLYFTPAQMLAHHASGGCPLNPGDLMGTGTISGPDRAGAGSLLETSMGGKEPITLPGGETRTFLQDGDEVTLTARASAPGAVGIGFGPCVGRIAPAE
ncbi:fumarylacetoacetase [Roseococcus sp. DSY-14]|uniref:fumarylacetoacetase n=1 Tax=Roseococcus sp. DSY-14 TaxID=3369650 RepID=UPI00387B7953